MSRLGKVFLVLLCMVGVVSSGYGMRFFEIKKETIAKEMNDLIRENKGKSTAEILKNSETWLKEKVDYINKILEGKKLNDLKLN